LDGRYIERITAILTCARQVADRQETRHIEPEHLLLGLLLDTDSNAGRLLALLGIPVEALRNEIEQHLASDRIDPRRGRLLSRQAYEVMATAHKEMRELHDRRLDTEHLLLALVEAELDALKHRHVNREVILKALFELRVTRSCNSPPDGVPGNRATPPVGPRNRGGEATMPAAEISIHDNRLLSYTVDGEKRSIVLHTVYADRKPHEYTDVVFSGVVAYHFEGDNFETILFDITEQPLSKVYEDDEGLFLRRKNYCWPVVDYNTADELLQKLGDQNIRAFVLTSSYGMDGFVLAQEMHVLPAS
jgi:hypothetical protein